MTKQELTAKFEQARIEWLRHLTFTGIKNEKGLIAYKRMVKAGEELDDYNYPKS